MDEKLVLKKLNKDFPMRKCECGKEFVARRDWVYKMAYPDNKNKFKYYCSYSCWRKAGGGHDKRISRW